jgi:hypothetical protein
MTTTLTCPACATVHPVPEFARDPHYCSIACYRTGHTIAQPEQPSCHDGVTMECPMCQDTFTPVGRQMYCTDACRAAAYRRRRDTGRTPVTVPATQPRRPITVYECDNCGTRALGEQRCEDCAT